MLADDADVPIDEPMLTYRIAVAGRIRDFFEMDDELASTASKN